VERDTMIDGYVCKVVKVIDTQYQFCINIFRQDGDRIYYYLENQFHLLYDFGASVGDTLLFSIKRIDFFTDSLIGFVPMKCVVASVNYKTVDGEELKVVNTNVVQDFEGFPLVQHKYDYMEKIGNLHVFMEEIANEAADAQYIRELRCYQDETISHRSDWFQQYGLECDHVGPTGIGEFDNTCKIYPNPFKDILCVKMENMGSIRIYDMKGGLLFDQQVGANYLQLSTSFLTHGCYMLQVNSINNGSSYHKIIKTK
jgi:hypothetical protein